MMSANRKLSDSLKLWLRVYRAPFLTASVAPVILGTSVGWYETGRINFISGLLALLGTIFAHFGANIFNDYYDHLTGCDDNNLDFTPFSGGSRTIQNGLLTARQAFWAGLVAFLLVVLIGLLLIVYTGRPALIIFGIVGLAIGFLYTAIPVKLAYRGLGEIGIFIAFGPLIVIGASYVQTGTISFLAFLASVPAGLLVMLILYANEILDEKADRSADKNTIIVKIANRNTALKIYRLILYVVPIWIIVFVIVGYFPYWSLIILCLMPKYIGTIFLSKKPFNDVKEMVPLSANTIQLQFLMTITLAISFILAGLTG
ncbi:MAG TPA: 1,4-dihydroxy-2-naphthoate octaprenyltransferase [Candidatus Marinimicrobia bacterium]|nr:1,4-dihydroxy-2-naphthoate octaprenyltransferase [Candidatus Neomarinimicrobiota bacterium]